MCARICLLLACLATPTSAEQTPQVERIMQIVLSQRGDPRSVAHLVQLARNLEPTSAASLYQQVAHRYLQDGHFDLAAEVLRQLLKQYANQPAACDGLSTLLQLYASGEVAHAETIGSAKRRSEHKRAGLFTFGIHLADQAFREHPAWAERPSMAFQFSVASRLSGQSQTAQGWLTQLKRARSAEPWRARALVEGWLQTNREEDAPLPVLCCPRTEKSPHLDGVLEESLWESGASTVAEKDPPTEVWLARDDQFLYLAVRCRKIPGIEYEADTRPRSYDADLADHDHVQISLDVDRDYATAYRLSIDCRGWTADTCWRNISWNPRWFVASGEEKTHWTVEAAIAWSQLTAAPPNPGGAWACAISRHPPGHSDQLPRSSSDKYALLLFP